MSPPSVTETGTSNTDATTAGDLPDSVGSVLVGTVSVGVIALGWLLGYPPVMLTTIIVSGIVAAIGTRAAVCDSVLRTVSGITVIWLAALLFVAGSAALMYQHAVAGPGGFGQTLVVASATLLAPFGVTNATIQNYGEGAGRDVLAQYLTGILVLALLIIVVSFLEFTSVNDFIFLGVVAGGAVTEIASIRPFIGHVVVTAILYLVFLFVLRKVVTKLPYPVLFTPDELSGVDEKVEIIYRAGRLGTWIVAITTVVIIAGTLLESYSEYPTAAVATDIASVFAATPVVLLVTAITVIMLLMLGAVAAARRTAKLDGLDIVKTIAPPTVLSVIAGVLSISGKEPLTSGLSNFGMGSVMQPGGVLYSIVTDHPSLLILIVIVTALIISSIVFAVPSMIAGSYLTDSSLAGVVASVLAVTAIVLVGVYEGSGVFPIVAGVALVAYTWELGEFSIVAAGELTPGISGFDLPEGFGSLAAIHGVTTLILTVIGVLISILLGLLVSTITVSASVALLAIIVCAVSIAVVLYLLSG
jgi:hypothetical protein